MDLAHKVNSYFSLFARVAARKTHKVQRHSRHVLNSNDIFHSFLTNNKVSVDVAEVKVLKHFIQGLFLKPGILEKEVLE